MLARKDVDFYLISFLHFTPPTVKGFFTRPVTARPEERDLARIKVRRFVAQSQPGKYALIVLAERLICWNRRTEFRKGHCFFIASACKFNLFGRSQTC